MTQPEQWVIVKIEQLDKPKSLTNPLYKVFGSWLGGYTTGDAWQMNSGIDRVNESESGNHFQFHGYSGSVYECIKGAYATGTSYTGGILSNMIEKGAEAGYEVTIMPKDTDWMNAL